MIPTILLAAGFGKRLRPYTLKTPKCLIKIKGRPLLDFWIERLSKNNFSPFLINSHYLPSVLKNFIKKNKFKKKIKLVYEPKLLGTAGTLIKNLDFFSFRDGLIMHADNYCKFNLKNFYKTHLNRPRNALMTMLTFNSNDPINAGIVKVDKNFILKEFYEKDINDNGKRANGAIYLISKEMQIELKNNYKIAENFSTDVIPYFKDKILTYHTNSSFFDIGTVKNYRAANRS